MIVSLALACALILVFLFIWRAYRHNREEDFATPEEKARTLRDWFWNHTAATYNEYILANPESNIVEYTEFRKMLTNKSSSDTERLTSITKALRL